MISHSGRRRAAIRRKPSEKKEFFVSFATRDAFLGATIVEASSPQEAIEVATMLGRNPGGEGAVLHIPAEARNEPDFAVYRTKLVGRGEALAMGGERLGDVSEEEREAFEREAYRLCEDCNRKH